MHCVISDVLAMSKRNEPETKQIFGVFMKALISALIALTGFQALADGIPQAPTSPYFYSCQVDGPAGGNNQRTYLHVDESFSEYASLWVTYYGGVVGQAVSKDI